jgi:hypothetical protein
MSVFKTDAINHSANSPHLYDSVATIEILAETESLRT